MTLTVGRIVTPAEFNSKMDALEKAVKRGDVWRERWMELQAQLMRTRDYGNRSKTVYALEMMRTIEKENPLP